MYSQVLPGILVSSDRVIFFVCFFVYILREVKWKYILIYKHSQKLLQIFQQTHSCLVPEKTFAVHHFWTPKNCILETLWKQMSVYFCISPSENFCFKNVVRFYQVGSGLEGGWRISLTQPLLGLIKCFTIFDFNWNFRKFNFYLDFDTLIYWIKTLKISRQIG